MADNYEEEGIIFDNLYNYEDFEVYETKLNNLISFQTKKFNKETYTPEPKKMLMNEKGQEEHKNIPLQNYIRWKYTDNPETSNNESKELELNKLLGLKTKRQVISNAKLVEWSDGTSQLVIGDQYYDVKLSDLKNNYFGVPYNDSIIVNKPISQRMNITPSDLDTKVEVSQGFGAQASKVKLAYNFYNPNEYKKEDYANVKFSKAKFKEFEKNDKQGRKKSDI
jgi:hypothetical protein